MKTSFRTVPDTNVVIASQNTSASSPNKEFFDRWEQDEFAVLYCEDTLREYIQKLLEHHVPRALIRKFIVELLELAEHVEITDFHFPKYPPDVDDIPFLPSADLKTRSTSIRNCGSSGFDFTSKSLPGSPGSGWRMKALRLS